LISALKRKMAQVVSSLAKIDSVSGDANIIP
jgi:hypothetical protein